LQVIVPRGILDSDFVARDASDFSFILSWSMHERVIKKRGESIALRRIQIILHCMIVKERNVSNALVA
jgi:hypothetical protein